VYSVLAIIPVSRRPNRRWGDDVAVRWKRSWGNLGADLLQADFWAVSSRGRSWAYFQSSSRLRSGHSTLHDTMVGASDW